MHPDGKMTGNWKTERSKSQIDTESHWQANCRDQLSLTKLGAGGVNTNAVTSDISGRFETGQLFYGFDLRSIFIHTREHTHTHMCTCVCAHTHIHMNYCFPWKHNTINTRNISQRESIARSSSLWASQLTAP